MPEAPPGLTLATNVAPDNATGRSALLSPSETSSSRLAQYASLTEAWEDAKVKFKDRTKKPIDDPNNDIDEYMNKWAASYEADNTDEARRKKKILSVIQNIIDGIVILGGVVSQHVSTTFGMAGPCFNALSFLLNVPRRIKHVYDSLLELFEEVEDFMVKFKILKRIDKMRRLPDEMIKNAGKMLISFVDICGLSIKLLEDRKVLTALKASFLNSDSGVRDALTRFRRMAQSLDSLTNTVAYDTITDVKEITRDTNFIVRDNSTILKSLEQTTSEDRFNRISQSRIATITSQIFNKEEKIVDKVSEFLEAPLPDTLATLEQCEKLRTWRNAPPRSGRAAFFIFGTSGSGKSWALEALRRSLDEQRTSDDRDEPNVYIAYHEPGRRIKKAPGSLIPFALRSMAVQVAEQSPTYARDLESIVKTNTNIYDKSTEDLWKTLKLFDLKPKTKAPDVTLYLLFDGVDQQETTDAFDTLKGLFVGNKAEKAQSQDKISIRAIFAVEQEISSSFASLDMDVAAQGLIESYISRELKRRDIFQANDKRSQKRRAQIRDALNCRGDENQQAERKCNFKDVNQKLERIAAAIQRDASSEELDRILKDESSQTIDPKVKQRIRELADNLSAKEISQVNRMLPWLLYSEYANCMETEELEAVLFLEHSSESLQDLTTKVRGKFRVLFDRAGIFVRLRPDVEDVLRENEQVPSTDAKNKKPLINLQLSICNAEASTIQKFIWQLNEQMSTGRFDFDSYTGSNHSLILSNELEGHLSIATACLKLLNEGWREETEILVRYAREYLPCHFTILAENMELIPMADRIDISHSLVAFLTDPYYLARDPDRHFGQGVHWLADSEAEGAIKKWLEKTQADLQAREKRWIKEVLDPASKRLDYLKDIARAVAKKWIGRNKENAIERSYETRVRKSNSLELPLFRWLSWYIENNKLEASETSNSAAISVGSELNSSTTNSDQVGQQQQQEEVQDNMTLDPPDTSKDNLSLMRTKTVVEPTEADKIRNAIDWLTENEIAYARNGTFHINIGYTYLAVDELDEAEIHFSDALREDATRRQALTGLGRLHFVRGQKVDAAAKLAEALTLFEREREQTKTFGDDQSRILAELCCELATIYKEPELMKFVEAANLYEKSLEKHDELDVRWKLLELLCRENKISDTERVLALLDKWDSCVNENRPRGLAHALFQSAKDDLSCVQLVNTVQAIRDSDVRSRMEQALSKAAQIEDTGDESSAKMKLQYLQGLAVVREDKEDRRVRAIELWKEALTSDVPKDSADWWYLDYLEKAARGVALHEFDLTLSKLRSDAGLHSTAEGKEILFQRLTSSLSFKGFKNPYLLQRFPIQQTLDRYLVSTNVEMERIQDAHQLLMDDLSSVIKILSDDDEENDTSGVCLLAKMLCSLGDRVGTLSAFSLFDRQSQEGAGHANDRALDSPMVDSRIKVTCTRYCDACVTNLSSTSKDGIWWCQYCDDIDFCDECYDRISSGQLKPSMCSPDHKFMRLYHTDYSEAEVAGNMVRVDWKWIDLGQGKFKREGGRTVLLSEWLQELWTRWKIPEAIEDIA